MEKQRDQSVVPELPQILAPASVATSMLGKNGAVTAVGGIVGYAHHRFSFRLPKGNKLFEQEQPLQGDPAWGAAIMGMTRTYCAFLVDHNKPHVKGRPLGEYNITAGFNGRKVVAAVVLHDGNMDDAIAVDVNVCVAYFH